MRVASFEIDGRQSYGMLQDGVVHEANGEFRAAYPDLRAALAAGVLSDLAAALDDTPHSEDSLGFQALIPNPDKVLCVGVNYRPHIEEMGREVPDHPVVFVRFAGSQTGHRQAVIKPFISDQFDFEGELAVVIGRSARHVTRQDALDYVAGYCCFFDGSVRDWQRHTTQFTPGKNFPNSGSVGPYLVTPDEIRDPTALTLITRINGVVMQEGCIADLVFDLPTLIEYCSTFAELLPGDIIATGTPGGVGAARTPPVWLKSGDSINVEISGLGSLDNTVTDELRKESP